jgi:short-subunit dehydrogenase
MNLLKNKRIVLFEKRAVLTEKRIVLTGASGGIGEAMALALAAEGAHMLLVGRQQDKLEALKQQLAGDQHHCVCADLATETGRAALLQACQREGIDMLINNAGISDFALLEEQGPEALTRIIELNLTSPMLLIQALLPLLKQRKNATIINIGSTFGSIGHPGFSAYCASKFGLRGFTETLRRELSDSAVTVHYLAPRATLTSINTGPVVAMNKELGNRMDTPAVVVKALLKLIAKKRGSNGYIGWPEKLFVRINGLLPTLVDKALGKQLATIRRHAS